MELQKLQLTLQQQQIRYTEHVTVLTVPYYSSCIGNDCTKLGDTLWTDIEPDPPGSPLSCAIGFSVESHPSGMPSSFVYTAVFADVSHTESVDVQRCSHTESTGR